MAFIFRVSALDGLEQGACRLWSIWRQSQCSSTYWTGLKEPQNIVNVVFIYYWQKNGWISYDPLPFFSRKREKCITWDTNTNFLALHLEVMLTTGYNIGSQTGDPPSHTHTHTHTHTSPPISILQVQSPPTQHYLNSQFNLPIYSLFFGVIALLTLNCWTIVWLATSERLPIGISVAPIVTPS